MSPMARPTRNRPSTMALLRSRSVMKPRRRNQPRSHPPRTNRRKPPTRRVTIDPSTTPLSRAVRHVTWSVTMLKTGVIAQTTNAVPASCRSRRRVADVTSGRTRDRDLRLHRLRDEALLMRLVVEMLLFHVRGPLHSAPDDAGRERDVADPGRAAALTLRHRSHCRVLVGIDH